MVHRDGQDGERKSPHLFQLLKNAIVDAILLEIDTHGIYDLGDDVIVDPADVCVRHVDERTST